MIEVPKDGYWHIRIQPRNEGIYYDEFDMNYEKLMNIVQKYNSNISFIIDGFIVRKNEDLLTIVIFHTNQKHTYYGRKSNFYYDQWYVFEKDYDKTEDFTNILLNPISENTTNVTGKNNTLSNARKNKNIFVVHGHDEEMKQTVARFLELIGLNPIILSEQANEGQTIIEKLEKNIDNCNYGIVLYSPCDRGGINEKNADLKSRARQNVVLEHGFLMGKFGRKRVCCIIKDNIEKPSDSDGILYIPYSNDYWKINLAKELKTAGYDIDLNRLA